MVLPEYREDGQQPRQLVTDAPGAERPTGTAPAPVSLSPHALFPGDPSRLRIAVPISGSSYLLRLGDQGPVAGRGSCPHKAQFHVVST